ncbi:MAG TPA: MCE family protein [Verrucomicrobiales bacterium]|nr:MCE family protein [Verrucomicrobiales bacterium]
MKNSLETKLGIFVALTLLAFIFLMEIAGSPNLFKKSYLLKGRFSNVHELKTGDAVKMAGVNIGTVKDIQIAGNQVEVSMNIHRDTPVPSDSIAVIQFAGLMGQNYVTFTLGTSQSPGLEPESLVTTADRPDLNNFMARLDNVAVGIENLTQNLTGDSINNILGPLTDFIRDNSSKISGIVENMETISERIREGEGTVGRLVNEDDLYETAMNSITDLQETASELRTMMQQAKGLIGNIEQGKGTLGKLAQDESLYRETTDAMLNLKEILAKINNGEGTVGELVNDKSLYRNAKMTLQKVDTATEVLEDQGPLTVIGTIAGSLF